MNIGAIIAATVLVAAVGLFIGVFLGVAGKKFAVEVDEKEVAVREALPGNNCGGCGYPGCDGLAAAIAKGEAPVNGCPVGGEPVGKVIAAIMGQEVVETARQVAYVKCAGTCEKTKDNYEYTGVEDCEMMAFIPGGGAKSCTYGCLGFGSCVKACPFGAIDVVNGVAVVDKEACKACGKCVAKCPKHLIELVPYEQTTFVQCSSHAKGKAVTSACEVGCIGCKKCEKTCPNGAITVDNFCAHIVRIVGLVKRFVRDILFSNGRKNCCVKAWRFFFSIKGCEYMFALWGGMWYDESEVMNLGRRMYHDCVCSWNGCGYD